MKKEKEPAVVDEIPHKEWISINGKTYVLWTMIMNSEPQFIGGTLEHEVDGAWEQTEIHSFTFDQNGDDVLFTVWGTDFNCEGLSKNVSITGYKNGTIEFAAMEKPFTRFRVFPDKGKVPYAAKFLTWLDDTAKELIAIAVAGDLHGYVPVSAEFVFPYYAQNYSPKDAAPLIWKAAQK